MYGDGGGWYSLLEQVSNRSLPPGEVLSRSSRSGSTETVVGRCHGHGSQMEVVSQHLTSLLEPSVAELPIPFGFTLLWGWLLARLMGKQIVRSSVRRFLELDPSGQTRFASPTCSRMINRSGRSSCIAACCRAWAPSAWHNYGTALNSLTQYQDALHGWRSVCASIRL